MRCVQEWRYDGYVTGDCGAAQGVFAHHHYVDSAASAVSATLTAGMNIDCGSILQQHTVDAVNNESLPLSDGDLDKALTTLFDIQVIIRGRRKLQQKMLARSLASRLVSSYFALTRIVRHCL